MIKRPYNKLLNFAWYQLLWFTAVLGGNSLEWVLVVLLAIHLAMVSNWFREAMLMVGVGIIGGSMDAVLASMGYFQFASNGTLPIPLWHIAIWIGFAGTFRHSMQFMIERPRLMTVGAVIFAPLTYLAAQRMGAVVFPMGNLNTAMVIGLCWLTITPVLVWLTRLTNSVSLRPFRRQKTATSTQEI